MSPLQPEEIFACLDRHGVRYVLIGGLAAGQLLDEIRKRS